VDLYYIPEIPTEQQSRSVVKAYALIIIKSKPGHEADHSLELTMDTPDGKQVNVTEKPEVVRIKSRLANVENVYQRGTQ
jgi:hypothetical protein